MLLSISEYRTIAKKVINYYCKKSHLAGQLLKDEESIGCIAEGIMRADHTYRPGTHLNRRSWRGKCARWALLKAVRQITRLRPVSLDSFPADTFEATNIISPTNSYARREKVKIAENKVQFLLENSGLTPVQKRCVRMYYLEELNFPEIGATMGISKQAVQQNVSKAMQSMKFTAGI